MKDLEKLASLEHTAPGRDLFPEIEAKVVMLERERKQVSWFAGVAVAAVTALFVLNVLEYTKPTNDQTLHTEPTNMLSSINQSYNLY